MKKCILLLVALSLTLSACSWMDGNFHSVTPHQEHTLNSYNNEVSAANYDELVTALEDMIASGQEKGIIYIAEYDQSMVEHGIAVAVRNTLGTMPLAAYAVDKIQYELGNNGGQPAIALEITYLHGRPEILKIRQVDDMATAEIVILDALMECDPSIVLQIGSYADLDIDQLVEDFAEEYPQLVMEIPQVAVGVYPEQGTARILELKFTYQNSREDLREMKTHVTSMFDAAELYVGSDDSDELKLIHLYSFLMERFDYHVETSITPTYSLLRHGVGDNKAFAVVYAAMCRQAGLECHVVTGTRNGEPWYWNIVLDGGNYYHVDLLRCSDQGSFQEFSDPEMTGYVWDYSAYPECPQQKLLPEEDENPPAGGTEDPPAEDPTEESTEPSTEEPTEPPSVEPTEPPTETTPPIENTEPTEPDPTEPENVDPPGSTDPSQ